MRIFSLDHMSDTKSTTVHDSKLHGMKPMNFVKHKD